MKISNALKIVIDMDFILFLDYFGNSSSKTRRQAKTAARAVAKAPRKPALAPPMEAIPEADEWSTFSSYSADDADDERLVVIRPPRTAGGFDAIDPSTRPPLDGDQLYPSDDDESGEAAIVLSFP